MLSIRDQVAGFPGGYLAPKAVAEQFVLAHRSRAIAPIESLVAVRAWGSQFEVRDTKEHSRMAINDRGQVWISKGALWANMVQE